jgi:nitrate/nitrite transport system ATP-binding protein
MAKPLIEIDHVDMVFPLANGKSYTALKDIHLEIGEGEFVTLLGHSGCGKSTLLNIVAGFLRPSAGGVVMSGRQVTEPAPDRMVVFQNYSLLPWKTVYGNVALAVNAVFPKISKAERRARIQQALEMVHLWEARHKYPVQLSGGMKQRVAIARALAITPKVLLLDEPFGALDALTRGSLQEELMEVCQKIGMTCLMVTHDVDEALLLADRVVLLTNGPSSRIGQILKVPFPRPRSRHEVVNHPTYYSLRQQIVDFLHQQKRRSAPAVLTHTLQTKSITIGYLPLTDCAPLVAAKELGLFAEFGLEQVELSREHSWGDLVEGMTTGRLQAAQMLAPLPIALSAGLLEKNPESTIRVPMVLSRNGIGITFGKQLTDQGVTNFAELKEYITRTGDRPVFGVVHPASMHNLLLRYELARAGIDPDHSVELVTAPPSQMAYHLKEGHISGFCVGQPWNSYALREGIGAIISTSLDIWDGHPEKVLGVNRDWALNHPAQEIALVKALISACEYCDTLRKRGELVEMLSPYLNLDAELLKSGFTQPLQEEKNYHRLHQFYVGQSYCPIPSEGVWMLTQLARWELTPFPQNWWEIADRTFQLEVFAQAARELELPDIVLDRRSFSLSDGIIFDADDPLSYLEQFPIRRAIDFRSVVLA